ncbi:MAG: hypothetical protein KKA73_06440 [Chloroflexi bacterium]|nr:hypothetical protein [Chloroflexota bacterium]MBU1747309.1 hypothetical protein [Chloroflexota bacterium]MBU1877949.1 hypothetical protein [Chloroflexota bacterium]
MAELTVLIRQQAYHYQIRYAQVNAPHGEQIPSGGYVVGETAHRELVPLSPRAAHLVDQLLLAEPAVRWGIVHWLVAPSRVEPDVPLARECWRTDQDTRQQLHDYLCAAYPRTAAKWL